MQDDNYNIIRPVETTQNVGAMSPIDRNAERKRKQQRQQNRRSAPDERDVAGESPDSGETTDRQGSIDYRA